MVDGCFWKADWVESGKWEHILSFFFLLSPFMPSSKYYLMSWGGLIKRDFSLESYSVVRGVVFFYG